MEWIGEVEIAKSLGEVKTSASITGKTMLPEFEILHFQRASGLRKIIIGNYSWIRVDRRKRSTKER